MTSTRSGRSTNFCEGPPTALIKSPRIACLARALGFGIKIALLSLLISSVARIWIHDLPLWKIFRRCASVSAILVLWHTFRRQPHPFRSLGLGPWREGRGALASGIVLGVAMVSCLTLTYDALDVIRIEVWTDTARVIRTLVTFVPAIGLVAVLEELTFRGYLLQQFLACSRWFALTASSLLYAVVHLRPQMVWPESGFELVGLFLLGWVLATAALRTRSLYLAIGLHASLAYFARVNKMFIEFNDPSTVWLMGSHRMVNGLIGWAALLLLALLVSRWPWRAVSTESPST